MFTFDEFSEKIDEMRNRYGFLTIYSNYDWDSSTDTVKHNFKDREFSHEEDGFYIEYTDWNTGEVYYEKMKNPTNLALWKAADRLVLKTTDRHHVFFEGISHTAELHKGLPIYLLAMGS